jgi:hypothetical protein
MARTAVEYALGRVLAWLRWSGGVPLGPDMTRMAIGIVEQAVAEGDAELIKRVMEALPQRIAMPEPPLPPATLPIKRASLGYAPYL